MRSLFQRTPKASYAATTLAAIAASLFTVLPAHAAGKNATFSMVRSPALAAFPACAVNAHAKVNVQSNGATETMTVTVDGLPAWTDFDFFVIQQPNGPFGMAWYQGDIETDANGHGTGKFIGRFSDETFIVAPGAVPAPLEHAGDATLNPATGPIHTFHLGLWFNSATDAAAAGCPATVTPFNGEHDAGVQVLNTSNFADLTGPLLKIKS